MLFLRSRGCPVTARLEARLRSDDAKGLNPVCRCQSADPMTVEPARTTGSNATVTVRVATPRSSYALVFGLILDGTRWLVDDTNCNGDPATSIYATPIRSCG
jgi:hypothetical protein